MLSTGIVFIYNLRDILAAKLHLVEHLAGALLAHWLATEQGRQTHVGTWADEMLAGAPTSTHGLVALHHWADVGLALHVVNAHTWHTSRVLPARRTSILTLLAIKLGADWAGDHSKVLDVLGRDGRTGWVLVEFCLWIVLDSLFGLDDVLAGGGLHDDAALHVHEISGLEGGGLATAGHFYNCLRI